MPCSVGSNPTLQKSSQLRLSRFTQNKEIRDILISTGKETIIEKTTNDYYWGCGKDGSEKNMLGIILMEIREKLLFL